MWGVHTHMCPTEGRAGAALLGRPLGARAKGGRAAGWRRWRVLRAACDAAAGGSQPLECSRALAAARAGEGQQASPLLADPWARSLLDKVGGGAAASSPLYAVVARWMDEQLLKAVMLANVERKQVVLVGDGFDTRPFRLPWPAGTVIYLVAPAEVHEYAEAALDGEGARVPRGCLLRRVPAGAGPGGAGFADALERAGFRADRLSVWALEGATCFGLSRCDLDPPLADLSNLAAFDSLVVGELPAMRGDEVENLLAAFGLLGAPISLESQPGWDRLADRWGQLPEGAPRPWLFVAHQKRLSLRQAGIVSDHMRAAEEADEDFLGNFS